MRARCEIMAAWKSLRSPSLLLLSAGLLVPGLPAAASENVATSPSREALDCRSPDGGYVVRVDPSRHEGLVLRSAAPIPWSELRCDEDVGVSCYSRGVFDAGYVVELEKMGDRLVGWIGESRLSGSRRLAKLVCDPRR
jgi:hypothetical protein